ncbi:hypothetical protein PENSPDRAFT_15030 [Peniophora sp. CONT]|nr:hypothetical protein PENSPDRAFT_15030 [Peniophora sp. CONT]
MIAHDDVSHYQLSPSVVVAAGSHEFRYSIEEANKLYVDMPITIRLAWRCHLAPGAFRLYAWSLECPDPSSGAPDLSSWVKNFIFNRLSAIQDLFCFTYARQLGHMTSNLCSRSYLTLRPSCVAELDCYPVFRDVNAMILILFLNCQHSLLPCIALMQSVPAYRPWRLLSPAKARRIDSGYLTPRCTRFASSLLRRSQSAKPPGTSAIRTLIPAGRLYVSGHTLRYIR